LIASPPRAGAIENASVEAAPTKKPLDRRRPPALDREADPGQDGDDPAAEHDDGLEDEARRGHAVGRPEARMRGEERKRRAEQTEQEHLPPEPGVERASAVLSHPHPCRHGQVGR
jgi:hypothetical protein